MHPIFDWHEVKLFDGKFWNLKSFILNDDVKYHECLNDDLSKWLYENFVKDTYYVYGQKIYFKNENDAIQFKLRWL